MATYRFVTKVDSESVYRALVLEAPNTNDAKEKSKTFLSPEENLIAIDVKNGRVWVNIQGKALKGVTIEKHVSSPVGAVFSGDAYTREEAENSGIQKKEMPHANKSAASSGEHGNDFGSALAHALAQSVIVCLLRVFTIPWTIWKGSVYRLAAEQRSGKTSDPTKNTEFPTFEWFRSSFDGLILLSWPIGVLVSLGIASEAYRGGGSIFVLGVIWTYFGVIGLSMLKEGLIMLLSIALNVEKIRHGTGSPETR